MNYIGDMAQYWVAFWMGIAALGCFGFLFLWSYARGQFQGVENPKNRLLEINQMTGVKK